MIQIVLVIYKAQLADSASFCTISTFLPQLRKYGCDMIVYNNSPEIDLPSGDDYQVVNADANRMLLGAYDYALIQAHRHQHDWLLLLDQDTAVTASYIDALCQAIDAGISDQVAALLPTFQCGKFDYPATYYPLFGQKWFNRPLRPGITDRCVAAFNSCALLRVQAIDDIGGFPLDYPLDNLDTAYLYRMYRRGWLMQIISCRMSQELSLLNYAEHMSHARYEMLIQSDLLLAREQGFIARCMLRLRVLCRIPVQILTPAKRPYLRQTISNLFQ